MSLDLVGLGSAIIDFAPANLGVPLSEVQSFVPSAGGAVSNLLVAASRLGLKTGFLGCVGDDEFGSFIMRDFEREGVDTSCVKRVTGRATGIAFYSIDEEGERHYVFYRFPDYSDPETMLRTEDIREEYIARSKMLHFSESFLRRSQTRGMLFTALQVAKERGVSVSYDPNMREDLWGAREEFLKVQRKALGFADVFLATRKEAALIAGGKTAEESANKVLDLGPSTVVIRGRRCYRVATQDQSFSIPLFRVKAVDTSGAGDAFDAGFLTSLIKRWSLDKAILLGGAVAALKVMKVGTRAGLPRIEEALQFIRERAKSDL
jgi:sugar/nucleoside kinase (ribokinase family)